MKKLFQKYRDVILYLFFGGCTTLVNMGVYALCYELLGVPNVPSVAIAWLLAVVFAFITNKLWVFDSKSWDRGTVKHEAGSFLAARAATGLLDVLIMYLAVDVMGWNGTVWKLISNILVVILNYIASRLFIFRKKENGSAGPEDGADETDLR